MSSPTGNRRNFYRLPMYVRVSLRVSGLRVPIPSTLINISGGGCQLHARTMLKTQSIVEFDLPRNGRPLLRLPGKVRKVTYTAQDRMFRYAIEFDTLPEAQRDELLRFISEEQRRTLSAARGKPDDLEARRKPSTRIHEQRAGQRVEVNMPVRFSVVDSQAPAVQATAVDVSTGGVKIIVDQVLRQEWLLTVYFTLPNETLKTLGSLRGGAAMQPFRELRVTARPLPGVKQSRGRFIQSLSFVSPDPEVTEEISRFVQATKLTAIARR